MKTKSSSRQKTPLVNSPTLPLVSVSIVLFSAEPKEVVAERFLSALSEALKRLDIFWNMEAFRRGMANPASKELISRLESLLAYGESVKWVIPESVRLELDDTVELVEHCDAHSIAKREKDEREAMNDEYAPLEEIEVKLFPSA